MSSGTDVPSQSFATFFHASWYARRYSGLIPAGLDPLQHFLQEGLARGFSPHPLFDTAWYLDCNPDVAAAGVPPFQHFIEFGMKEGRDPHPLFDTTWYRDRNPDLASSGLSPFQHYIELGMTQGLDPHPLFDTAIYTERYGRQPDTLPLLEFLIEGWGAGRNPSLIFDADWYLNSHPDILAAGVDPFEHFVLHGMREGRSPTRLFDARWYRDRYLSTNTAGDLGMETPPNPAIRGRSAVEHFLKKGISQDCDPHPLFDTKWYSSHYFQQLGDVAPFKHYLRNPSLKPNRLFDPAFVAKQLIDVSGRANSGSAPSPELALSQSRNDPHPSGTQSDASDSGVALRGARTLLDQYLAHRGKYGLRPCALFDPAYYTEANPDVVQCGLDPEWHFLNFGLHEARQPCREFNLPFVMAQVGTTDPERIFWSSIEHGLPPGVRTRLTFVPSTDKALLERMQRVLRNGLPTILMISHFHGGGTAKHIRELAEALEGQANSLLLSPSQTGELVLEIIGGSVAPMLFQAVDLPSIIPNVINALGVNRVHVHHVLGLSKEIVPLLMGLGLPYDVTLHDTYFLTPNPMFVHSPEARSSIGLEAAMTRATATPLPGSKLGEMTRTEWAEQFAPMLRRAERLIAPTRFIAELYRLFDPQLNPIIAPHLEIARPKFPLQVPPLGPDDTMTIAVLGNIVHHKGLGQLIQCAIQARNQNLSLNFVLIGTAPNVHTLQGVGVSVHGGYDDDNLPRLLRKYGVHAVWFPSLAPESYCYTLTIGLWSGLAIFASDVGCFPERLEGVVQATVASVSAKPEIWLQSFETVRGKLRAGAFNPLPVRPGPDSFYRTHYLAVFSPAAATPECDTGSTVWSRHPSGSRHRILRSLHVPWLGRRCSTKRTR